MEFGVPKPGEVINRALEAPRTVGRGVLGVIKFFTSDKEGFDQRRKQASEAFGRVDEQLKELENRGRANSMAEEVLHRAASGMPMDEPLRSLKMMLGDPESEVTLDNIWLAPGHAEMLLPLVEDVLVRPE